MAELGRGAGARLVYEVSDDPGACPRVKLRGELDMTTAPELESAVAEVLRSAPSCLVVDASELEFADSSAIALLIRWANSVSKLEIRQPPELLRQVITRMGLSGQLEVSP